MDNTQTISKDPYTDLRDVGMAITNEVRSFVRSLHEQYPDLPIATITDLLYDCIIAAVSDTSAMYFVEFVCHNMPYSHKKNKEMRAAVSVSTMLACAFASEQASCISTAKSTVSLTYIFCRVERAWVRSRRTIFDIENVVCTFAPTFSLCGVSLDDFTNMLVTHSDYDLRRAKSAMLSKIIRADLCASHFTRLPRWAQRVALFLGCKLGASNE